MLSEERVKLMTRMASFEDNEGKEYASASTHFRGDYVGAQVLKAVICATIAYMIAFGVYIYYNYETFMTDIYKMDIWAFATSALKWYAVVVVVYSVIVYIVFSIKYTKARQGLKKYFNNLKLLGSLLVKESEEKQE